MLKFGKLGRCLAVVAVGLALGSGAVGRAAEWVNVTNNVGGETWGAYGVHYMAAVPGSSAVIAGVSERGLWASMDEGVTWKKLGGNEINGRPDCVVFDPKDSKIFWVSECYGDAPFETVDGGKTFVRLGKLKHADTVAVDFSDPERKTLLLGMHEQAMSLQMSGDGGKTWNLIGNRLPAGTAHCSNPIILDSKTFLVNASGWQGTGKWGIFRSEDAGQSWATVSEQGPSGTGLVASDGAIYWQRTWGGGLLKSVDKGKTWSQISNAIASNPVEMPEKKLAGFKEKQVLVSSDGGKSWTKFGPAMPFKATGIVYSAKGECFYAWQTVDKKPEVAIVRLSAK